MLSLLAACLADEESAAGASVDVDMSNTIVANTEAAGTVISNIKIDSDGMVYESNSAGSYGAATETWLTSGLNSEVWVERQITSGTLTTDDIGASRVACTSDLETGVTRAAPGTKTAQVIFSFYDAASGGNLLDTAHVLFEADILI
jgi:hypothetical protein